MTQNLTAISLFSGIGGLDLAASLAGFDIVAQIEINEFCRKVLQKHAEKYWPHAAQFTDVRDVGGHNLPAAAVIFGGFPCQDVSLAGKRAGLVGARSGLWYEFRRIIGEVRPVAVVLENVPGMYARSRKERRQFPRGGTVGITAGRVVERPAAPPPVLQVVCDLAALGYVGHFGSVMAADAGAPHFRERFFLVAFANGLRYASKETIGEPASDPQRDLPAYECQWSTVTHAVVSGGANVADTNGAGLAQREGIGRNNESECTAIKRTSPSMVNANSANGKTRQPNQMGARKPEKEQASTLASRRSTKSRLGGTATGLSNRLDFPGWPARPGEPQFDYEPPRVTSGTPNRAARLHALGNAVVPQVAYPIFAALYQRLTEADE